MTQSKIRRQSNMKHLNKNLLLALAASSMVLTACDDDSISVRDNATSNTSEVKTSDDLPSCNSNNEGKSYYVKDEDADYLCKSGKWKKLDGEDETSVAPISKNCPAKGDKGYKSNWEYLNPSIEYDCIQDDRDNQYYKTVKIGEQTWMAENMNYGDESKAPNLKDGNWCYDDDSKNCKTYGRLYTWAAAMNLESKYNEEKATNFVKDNHQGVCPVGWHVPTNEEYSELYTTIGSKDDAGNYLKAPETWNRKLGTDKYGFSLLSMGSRDDDGNFNYQGQNADLWSATERATIRAYNQQFGYDYANVVQSPNLRYNGYALRCLKNPDDEDEPKSSSSIESSSSVAPISKECPAKGDKGYKSNWEYLNPSVEYNCIQDDRDDQYYKTVKIGKQTWMAENLNYRYVGIAHKVIIEHANISNKSDSTSWCYENNSKYCETYGRLYTWAAAMDSAGIVDNKNKVKNKKNGTGCGYNTTCTPNTPHRGICPSGWHVPTEKEFETMRSTTSDKIRSSLWEDNDQWKIDNDEFGFSLLQAGMRTGTKGDFFCLDYFAALLWTASDSDEGHAYYLSVKDSSVNLHYSYDEKYQGFPLRCLMDSDDTVEDEPSISESESSSSSKPKSSSSSKPESSSSSKPKSSSSSFISSSSKDVSSSSSIEPSSSATPPSKKCPAKGDKGYKSNWEYLNPNIEYDCILDERDNQYYKTVEIGEQTWIAENMNYSDESKTPNLVDGNWCYENDLKNCETYGHLYTWAAAINLDRKTSGHLPHSLAYSR